MVTINLIRPLFILMSALTGLVGLLLNYLEPYLPILVTRTYRYGKYAINTHQPLVTQAEIPKRWFKHFYVFAAPSSAVVLFLVIRAYLFDGYVPENLLWFLDILLGPTRQPLASAQSTLLASIILSIQCWKRLYETRYVTVYSNAKMNVSHYLAGYIHYVGALVCVIGESEGFVKGSTASFSWSKLTTVQLICACIFLLASYGQLNSNFILRQLRKDGKDNVVNTGYKIPHGGLYNYVSGALHLTEITMYIMLSVILWETHTYHYVTLWVIVNQMECALLTHRWYLETFKSYPKNRKALIPYVL